MTEHDFSDLFEQYPNIIEEMPEIFTSHEFILKLAQQNQAEYVEALHAYCHKEEGVAPTPFMTVHGILAKGLNSFPKLIELFRTDAPSKDIFGRSGKSALWKKVH